MDAERGKYWSKGLSTLEKSLIFLFVAMACVSISFIALYFTEKSDSSAHSEGEFIFYHLEICVQVLQDCIKVTKSFSEAFSTEGVHEDFYFRTIKLTLLITRKATLSLPGNLNATWQSQ